MRRRPTPDPVGPGQESVWDYPVRVLETSHPPVYYVPVADVAAGVLRPNPRRTSCEFKGQAAYLDVVGADGRVEVAGSQWW